jgi:NAD(P)-dependent dehydrogenase (short-subunit alcohol dehydrogenase family)
MKTNGTVAKPRTMIVTGASRGTASTIAATAIDSFGSIDGVVNNAGVFFTKPFTGYTPEDFELLNATNLQGYIYITQLAVKRRGPGGDHA